MMNEQGTQRKNDEEKRDSGLPGGGQGRIDEVGKSGIYPVSEMEGASDDAVVHDEASFGQGDRGADGYEDSGTSEIIPDERIGKTGGENRNDKQ